MIKLKMAFCRTVFRKADFVKNLEDGEKRWISECNRLGLNAAATSEFAGCVTHAWIEDPSAESGTELMPEVANNRHANAILDAIAGVSGQISRERPEYGPDKSPWFELELGIDHCLRRKAQYTNVEFWRHDGCPLAVSSAAMEIRAAIKNLIRKAKSELKKEKSK